MTLPATQKPQALAARAFILALQANRDGKLTDEQTKAVGDNLDAVIAFHGKP